MSECSSPRRGDEVEAWIKRTRDSYCSPGLEYEGCGQAWYALDDLLDDYRLHADTGTSLDAEAAEVQSHWSELQQPLVERMEPIAA